AQDGLLPTRGARVELLADWYLQTPGAPDPYLSAELRSSFYRPAGERGVLFLTASGGSSFGQGAPVSRQFTLGGPLRLGAYGVNELRGSEYLFGSAGYMRRVGRLPQFAGGKVYVGASVEYGAAFERLSDADFAACISAGLVMETLAGPVFFGGSWGEGSRRTAYFAIGHPFP
ncbi:MAG: BamA/TamA family outer membrane protein, partial [Armatimonadota bacterium]